MQVTVNVTTKYRCMECGADCVARQFHDYIECVRYRWSNARPRPKDGEKDELRTAESDIKSLLAWIDAHRPAPRSYEVLDAPNSATVGLATSTADRQRV